MRDERRRQNLSMNALAQKAGLSQQMVSYTERGMRVPTLDTAARMAEALGFSLSEFVRRGEEKMPRAQAVKIEQARQAQDLIEKLAKVRKLLSREIDQILKASPMCSE